jgi:hypothetical protein
MSIQVVLTAKTQRTYHVMLSAPADPDFVGISIFAVACGSCFDNSKNPYGITIRKISSNYSDFVSLRTKNHRIQAYLHRD